MLSIIIDGVGWFLSSHCFWKPRLKQTNATGVKTCTYAQILHSDLSCTLFECAFVVYACAITSYFASSPLRRPMFCAVSVIWGSRLEGSPICGFCSYTPFIFSSASLRSDRGKKGLLFWKCQHSFGKVLSAAARLIRRGGMGRSFHRLEDMLYSCMWHQWGQVKKCLMKKSHPQL